MVLGLRIARWRALKGMSRQQLADVVGVSVAAVYQWEGVGKGKRKRRTRPSVANLELIAKGLGLSLEEFFGEVSSEARAS